MSRETLPTEAEIETRLRRDKVLFPPLVLTWDTAGRKEKACTKDGVVQIAWQKKAFRFVAECKRLSNPKTVRVAVAQVRQIASLGGLHPLVVVPYLTEQTIDELESEQISGIDLCGNGIVTVPGELLVRRTGANNRFQTDGVIKNVYRNNSSVVARLFLAQPEFDSVHDAHGELNRRGGRVTLSTVSKVCKGMENDLIIDRTRGGSSEEDCSGPRFLDHSDR